MPTADVDDENLRNQSSALCGRAQGVIIGSLIAFGWAFYAASNLATGPRYVVIAVAAGVAVSLLIASAAIVRLAHLLPLETAAQTLARRRIPKWFWLNLLAEIILLNVAVTRLASPELKAFWIPAISVVVGLHSWPMAIFFRVRSYWVVGAAVIVFAAAATIIVIHHPESASAAVHSEAFVTAIILWSASAAGVVSALGPRRQSG